MRREPPRNVAASIQARLRNLARSRGEDNQSVLTRYVTERLLYRLSLTPYRDRFILKGARLFELWTGEVHRPTRDLDFLGYGDPSLAAIIPVFQAICRQPVAEDDGIVFLPESIAGERARADQEYQGATLKVTAQLGSAATRLQVDFGFGDTVTPQAQFAELPAMLDLPPPRLMTYPRETVIAEKLQAMVSLGMANSRMKDFYDVWYLARRFDFDGRLLARAVEATFRQRNTALPPGPPTALTPEFYDDPNKQTQWRAFVRRSKLTGEGTSLAEIASVIRDFLLPPLLAVQAGQEFGFSWLASHGAWQPQER